MRKHITFTRKHENILSMPMILQLGHICDIWNFRNFCRSFLLKNCFAVVLIDWLLKLLLWSISSNDEATFPDKTGGARVKWNQTMRKHMIKDQPIGYWSGKVFILYVLKVLHTATWYITPNFYTKPSQNNHHQHGLLIQRHYDEQNFPYYQPSHNAKPYDQSLTTH